MNYLPFLETSWLEVLKDEMGKPYFLQLLAFIAKERALGHQVYPPQELLFNALNKTPFDQVKVVVVGQDPYHGPGQAHGLSFSVPKGVPLPPSLQNIFKELLQDVGVPIPTHGSLLSWAEQGVLLLNATLTVRQGEPMSHHGKGWEQFTDVLISKLCSREKPVGFMLWGKSAQEKCKQVALEKRHLLLTSPHPSPFSAHQGFFGSKHFSKINAWLKSQGMEPIEWGT